MISLDQKLNKFYLSLYIIVSSFKNNFLQCSCKMCLGGLAPFFLVMVYFIPSSKIYDKIDKDQNGKVTEEELKEWIQFIQKRYIVEDTERQWKEHDPEGDAVSWESYKKRTYGFMEDEDKGTQWHCFCGDVETWIQNLWLSCSFH